MPAKKYRSLIVATVVAIMYAIAPMLAQTSSTVAGTVKDEQGGIIPGATVTLVSEARGTTFEGQSGGTGDFVISNIPADTYTIRVTMDGFKTTERKGVAISLGERVAVGTVTIQVGTLAETVLVTGEAPIIQAQTGERSFTVAKEAVENLPVTTRYFGQFAALAPGVVVTGNNRFARIDGARTNYMLDGISSVNTGGNQPGLELNADAIAEVKVVTSAYQAGTAGPQGYRSRVSPRAARISSADRCTTSSGRVRGMRTPGSTTRTAIRNRCLRKETGATRSAARSASQAARTSSSSSTPNSSRRGRAAAPSIASACRRCSSGRETFRRRPTTPAPAST